MVAEYLNSFLCHMNVLARRIATKNDLSLSQYYTLSNISSNGISMSKLSLVIGIDNRGRGTRGGSLKARDGHYRASQGGIRW